jgi:DNA-binding transcriptional LysR family regulator
VLSRPELKIVVLRAGCSYRQRLESLLAARGIVGLRRLEFGTIEGILGCVAAGIGVTLLPRGIVAPAASEGRVALHDLARDEALVDTVFVRRRGAYASTALTAFLAAARPPARAEAAA